MMTPEAQRIAIAEACGWTEILRPCDDAYHYLPTDTLGFVMGRVCGIRPRGIHIENAAPLPDYLNDLNEMHEAEKVLTEKGANAWFVYIEMIVRLNATPFEHSTIVHATAAQRAEALLRTIGKWEGE
jgi:hypothetical protein